MNARAVQARCSSCGGQLDQGTADQWTCERCGDEWEPHLADWRLSVSQEAALRILARWTERRGLFACWTTNRNDPEVGAIAAGSAAVLVESLLAEPGNPGYLVATDLGLLVAAALPAEGAR